MSHDVLQSDTPIDLQGKHCSPYNAMHIERCSMDFSGSSLAIGFGFSNPVTLSYGIVKATVITNGQVEFK